MISEKKKKIDKRHEIQLELSVFILLASYMM